MRHPGRVVDRRTLLPELSGKWLELIREAVPGLARVAVL
jgi:hypothetical protein